VKDKQTEETLAPHMYCTGPTLCKADIPACNKIDSWDCIIIWLSGMLLTVTDHWIMHWKKRSKHIK